MNEWLDSLPLWANIIGWIVALILSIGFVLALMVLAALIGNCVDDWRKQ